MNREIVIVYIDENTDDGMMWEELNQEGQMQVSVYDEEFEYDVEYHHSIVIKSLQEHLAKYGKQVRKQVMQEVYDKFLEVCEKGAEYNYVRISKIAELLDELQGENK